MGRRRAYIFIGFDSHKPYKFIWFGEIHGPKTCKCIWFCDIHGPKPYNCIWFGDIHGPKPFKLIRFDDRGLLCGSFLGCGEVGSDAVHIRPPDRTSAVGIWPTTYVVSVKDVPCDGRARYSTGFSKYGFGKGLGKFGPESLFKPYLKPISGVPEMGFI